MSSLAYRQALEHRDSPEYQQELQRLFGREKMQGYNFDFAMSARISATVVEEIIKNTVETQTGKKVASVSINISTDTQGYGVTEQDVTVFDGVTVYFESEK